MIQHFSSVHWLNSAPAQSPFTLLLTHTMGRSGGPVLICLGLLNDILAHFCLWARGHRQGHRSKWLWHRSEMMLMTRRTCLNIKWSRLSRDTAAPALSSSTLVQTVTAWCLWLKCSRKLHCITKDTPEFPAALLQNVTFFPVAVGLCRWKF